ILQLHCTFLGAKIHYLCKDTINEPFETMKKDVNLLLAAVVAAAGLSACNPSGKHSTDKNVQSVLTVSPADFEAEIDGDSVKLYTWTNGTAVAAITNYG